MIQITELSFLESKKLLYTFQKLEKSYGADWYDCEEEDASYIWIIENIDNPLGFLSYKVFLHPNQRDFIYIVKIYVREAHRGENPILIDNRRVSKILFREINKKDVDLLTLESADEKLDKYYKKLGFQYNADISREIASIIGINEQVMYRAKINRKVQT